MRYRVLRHPRVADDLEAAFRLIAEYAGFDVAAGKLGEIERRMRDLGASPHVGSVGDGILPGLRAIPAARKGVIVFRFDDAAREVLVLCVTYAGADWIGRSAGRGKRTRRTP